MYKKFLNVVSTNNFFKGGDVNKLVAVAQVAVCFVLLLCVCGSGQNRPAELVGHWISDEDEEEYSPFSFSVGGRGSLTVYEMELFSDGTAIFSKSSSDNSAGTWKVVDKRFVASVTVLGSPIGLALNYKLSGYELVVIDGDGDSSKYIRKEKSDIIKQAKRAFERGEKALDNDKYDEAIAAFNEAIKLYPNYAEAYVYRGDAYNFGKKNYDKAIADYTEAIRLNPKNGDYYDRRGNAYSEKKDYERAIADQTKAIELEPRNASFYGSRCWAYGNKGDYDKAIADCNQAIRLDPKDALPYHSRGFAYLGKKDYDKAIADFKAALRIAPDLEEAKDDLEKAKKLKGNR
jgi:tetratricopeptide (TPR) repeat protein